MWEELFMEHHPKNVARPPERIRSHARQGHRRFGASRFIVVSPQGPPLEAKVNEKSVPVKLTGTPKYTM